MKYTEIQEKCSFLSELTTVLPASGPVGLHTETLSGLPVPSLDASRMPKRSKWQDRDIISDKMNLLLNSNSIEFLKIVLKKVQGALVF